MLAETAFSYLTKLCIHMCALRQLQAATAYKRPILFLLQSPHNKFVSVNGKSLSHLMDLKILEHQRIILESRCGPCTQPT